MATKAQKQTVENHIEVLQAFVKGKQIECNKYKNGEWGIVNEPTWDFHSCVYRICDPYRELKTALKEGKTIQVAGPMTKIWFDIVAPAWDIPVESYRIKPEVDPYAESKEALIAGKTIQSKGIASETWRDIEAPLWNCLVDMYRIKPEEDPYKEIKEAYNDGKIIQYLTSDDKWNDIKEPSWVSPVYLYRIKPDEDPYKEFKEAHKSGKTIQALTTGDDKWYDIMFPIWKLRPVQSYRIKPEEMIELTVADIEKILGKKVRIVG